MKYEVSQDRTDSTAWRTEAIDHDSEGECYVVEFWGPQAEERAREYAEFKNRLRTNGAEMSALNNVVRQMRERSRASRREALMAIQAWLDNVLPYADIQEAAERAQQ